MVLNPPGQKLDTLPEKQLKQNRAGGVTQVVKHLPNKHARPGGQAPVLPKKKKKSSVAHKHKVIF
jgi:hypothetical protein